MEEIGEEEVAGVLRVGVSRAHQGFRYPTEVRKKVVDSCRMVAFPLLTLLTRQSGPLDRVRVRTLEVFGHYCLRHPD